jgi:hypothetical protein
MGSSTRPDWTLFHDAEPRIEIEMERWRFAVETRFAAAEVNSGSELKRYTKQWFSELNLCTRNRSTLCLGRVVSEPLWEGYSAASAFLGEGAAVDGFGWGVGSLEEMAGWKTRVGFDGEGSYFWSLSAFGNGASWQTILAHRRFDSGFFGEFPTDRTQFLTRFGVRSYDEFAVAARAGRQDGLFALSGLRVRSTDGQLERGKRFGESPVDMRVVAQALYGLNARIAAGAGVLGLSQVRGVELPDSRGKRQTKSQGTSAIGGQFLARLESERLASELAFELVRKSGDELVSASSFMASGKIDYSWSLLWGLRLRTGE